MPLKEQVITGYEDLGDLSRPEQALAQFYRAFNTRDMLLMSDNWEQGEEAIMDNPLGGIKRGWPEIRAVYERIFNSSAKVQVEFYDYTIQHHGAVFLAIGRERGRFEQAGRVLDLAIRTTRIFRSSGKRWRQVHHHGSFDDPSLLEAYQRAVRSADQPKSDSGSESPGIIRKPLLLAIIEGEIAVARVDIREITFSAHQRTSLHSHPCPVLGYIAEGAFLFQIEGEPEKLLPAGAAFFEPANTRITHFDNATDRPATFIAFYLLSAGDHELIEMLE